MTPTNKYLSRFRVKLNKKRVMLNDWLILISMDESKLTLAKEFIQPHSSRANEHRISRILEDLTTDSDWSGLVELED